MYTQEEMNLISFYRRMSIEQQVIHYGMFEAAAARNAPLLRPPRLAQLGLLRLVPAIVPWRELRSDAG